MDRRFFDRTDTAANGELIWATKGLAGRVQTHRAYLMTENLSVDGAKVALRGKHHLPPGVHARFKLGLEFSEVELLDATYPTKDRTILRFRFLTPSRSFLEVVEKYLPALHKDDSGLHTDSWVGGNW